MASADVFFARITQTDNESNAGRHRQLSAPKGAKGDSDEDTAEAAGDETGEEDGAES